MKYIMNDFADKSWIHNKYQVFITKKETCEGAKISLAAIVILLLIHNL
jgi:hypothetical protein